MPLLNAPLSTAPSASLLDKTPSNAAKASREPAGRRQFPDSFERARPRAMSAASTPQRYDGLLQSAKSVAQEAGEKLRIRFAGDVEVRYKGFVDPVTDADEKIEEFIKGAVKAQFPMHSIWAEEGGRQPDEEGRVRWVIDPIDGTTNFLRRNPVFSVLIGVQEREGDGEFQTVAAVVHDPLRREMFTATRGGGAFLNDVAIRTSTSNALPRMLCATDYSYDRLLEQQSNHAETTRMSLISAGIRTSGSAGLDLAWVAAGRLDLSWHHALKPWDMAPGALLVEEAGGTVTNLFGDAFHLEGKSIAASNGRAHALCIEQMRIARSLPIGSREGMEQFLSNEDAEKLRAFRQQTGL